jgi:multidrug efflux pump subunit AcrB
MALVGIGWVKVKMLPFDNKSEFQIVLNMPEGSALERTVQAAREIAATVRDEPEVTDYQVYAGWRHRSTSTAWYAITSCGGARI